MHHDFFSLHPRANGEHQNQEAHAAGCIAVDHLNPRFLVRHRASGHGGLLGTDLRLRANWRGLAIAARPIGATEARIREPRECAKQREIKRQKNREQSQQAQSRSHALIFAADPDPK